MALFSFFSKNPLTLAEMTNVDEGRQERSQSLSVKLDEVYHKIKKESIWDKIRAFFKRNKTDMNQYYTILKFLVSSPSGSEYVVLIEFQPSPNLNQVMNNKVRVYCSCPSFKYQSAYYLNKRGNVFRSAKTDVQLGRALTDEPDKKKTKVSVSCKHIFACINWMNNNMNYLISRL